MTSLPPNADELVSAYVDGEATPEEIALVDANPELVARVRELQVLADAVAEVSSPPATVRESHLGAAMAAFDALHAEDERRPFTAAPPLATTDQPASPVVSMDQARAARVEREQLAPSRRRNWRLPGVAAAAAVLAIVFAGIVALGFNSNTANDVADSAAAEAPQVSSANLEGDDAADTMADSASDAAADAVDAVEASDGDDEEAMADEEAAMEAEAEEEAALSDEADAAMNDAMEDDAMDEDEAASDEAPAEQDGETATSDRGERVPPASGDSGSASSSSSPAPERASGVMGADDSAEAPADEADDPSAPSTPIPAPTATVEESLPALPPASPSTTTDTDEGTDEEAPFASGPAPSPPPQFVDLGPFPDAGSFFETLSQLIADRPELGTVEDPGLVGACDETVEVANGPTQFFGVADVAEDLVELYRAGDGKTVVVAVRDCQGLIP